eukprot:1143869-Pelagomonas_calceolata.AAC.4
MATGPWKLSTTASPPIIASGSHPNHRALVLDAQHFQASGGSRAVEALRRSLPSQTQVTPPKPPSASTPTFGQLPFPQVAGADTERSSDQGAWLQAASAAAAAAAAGIVRGAGQSPPRVAHGAHQGAMQSAGQPHMAAQAPLPSTAQQQQQQQQTLLGSTSEGAMLLSQAPPPQQQQQQQQQQLPSQGQAAITAVAVGSGSAMPLFGGPQPQGLPLQMPTFSASSPTKVRPPSRLRPRPTVGTILRLLGLMCTKELSAPAAPQKCGRLCG